MKRVSRFATSYLDRIWGAELNEACKFIGIKAGPADQCSIDVGLTHEFCSIHRLDGSAVLDPDGAGRRVVGHDAQLLTNGVANQLCIFSSGVLYASDVADALLCVDFCCRRIIKKNI